MNKNELQKILELHKLWLNDDPNGVRANLRSADLSNADLRSADLYGADLYGADLIWADLRKADLRDAKLSNADLRKANLRGANLRGADLFGAYLIDANLRGANLRGADLIGADLIGADLSNADLRGADLRGAVLSNANLYGADLRGAKNVPFIPISCPDKGSFIGYKKASGYIVELKVLEDAKRSSATGRKCRCNKAKVLSITKLSGESTSLTEIASSYDPTFVYRVGEIVEEPNFCDDRWNECAAGIHFFINRQEAVDYGP
jgi:hypothetical protein